MRAVYNNNTVYNKNNIYITCLHGDHTVYNRLPVGVKGCVSALGSVLR